MECPQSKKSEEYEERKNVKMYGKDAVIHIVEILVTEIKKIQYQGKQRQ
jgi:hypothetical protein